MRKVPTTEKLRVVPPCYSYGDLEGFLVYTDETYYYLAQRNQKEKTYSPKVGDYRIKYSYLGVGANISIIGAQVGNTIGKFKNKLLLVANGMISASKMLDQKLEKKAIRQKIIRILSIIGTVIGFILLT